MAWERTGWDRILVGRQPDITRGRDWLARHYDLHREIKRVRPEHHYLLDVSVERDDDRLPLDHVAAISGRERHLLTLDDVRNADAGRVAEEIRRDCQMRPQGAGGMAIVTGAELSAGRLYGMRDDYGLTCLGKLPSQRKVQSFSNGIITVNDFACFGEEALSIIGILERDGYLRKVSDQNYEILPKFNSRGKREDFYLSQTVEEYKKDKIFTVLRSCSRFWQRLQFQHFRPYDDPRLLPLGELGEISFYHQPTGFESWLDLGHQAEPSDLTAFVPNLKVALPPHTDHVYYNFWSQEGFDDLYVLGAAGNVVARHFGLLGPERLATRVIGHDGHPHLFMYEMYRNIRDRMIKAGVPKDDAKRLARQEAKEIIRQTINAAQIGTVNIAFGNMVDQQYDPEEVAEYNELGKMEGRQDISALNIAARLAGNDHIGVVSEPHRMATIAEEKMSRARLVSDPIKLLPPEFDPDKVQIYSDTLAMREWLGPALTLVMDYHRPRWEYEIFGLGRPEVLTQLLEIPRFMPDIEEALNIHDEKLVGLLAGRHIPTLFGTEIPGNAIVDASWRRGTTYKTLLLIKILKNYEIMEAISARIGRPIVYLLAGLAHEDDVPAIGAVQELNELIEKINKRGKGFSADWIIGHSFEQARWLLSGLGKRGIWISSSNPFTESRSQMTEAQGPSSLKALLNLLRFLGTDDGGGSVLRNLPAVEIYGPTTSVAGLSYFEENWLNRRLIELAIDVILPDFYRGLERVSNFTSADLAFFEMGKGHLAPGLPGRVSSMLKVMAGWNGQVILDALMDRPSRVDRLVRGY